MTHAILVRASLFCVGLYGCSGPDGAMDSTEGPGSSATGDDTSGDDCEPFPGNDCEISPNDDLCPPAILGLPGCGPQELHPTSGHQCVAAALRGGTRAALLNIITVDSEMSPESNGCGYYDLIYVLGDGTAMVERDGGEGADPDLGFIARRVEIRPPEFFDDCVESDDHAVVQACLTDWFVPDSCVPGVCCPRANATGHPVCE